MDQTRVPSILGAILQPEIDRLDPNACGLVEEDLETRIFTRGLATFRHLLEPFYRTQCIS